MDTLQQALLILLMGLGAIIAVVFTVAASLVMVSVSTKAWRTFVAIDHNPATLEFGESLIGKYLHDQLKQLVPLVDSPDDTAIRNLASLPALKRLYETGVIDQERFAAGASKLITDAMGLGVELLNAKKVESPPAEDMG